MRIVADTNIFLAVALREPERERIIRLTSGTDVAAPEILPYEIGNALSAMLKRGKIGDQEVLAAQKATDAVPVRLIAVAVSKALKLAMEFDIYAYDAYFLQCALALSSPLITLDKRMIRVARALNIEVLE